LGHCPVGIAQRVVLPLGEDGRAEAAFDAGLDDSGIDSAQDDLRSEPGSGEHIQHRLPCRYRWLKRDERMPGKLTQGAIFRRVVDYSA
jgi:hypothetical protein